MNIVTGLTYQEVVNVIVTELARRGVVERDGIELETGVNFGGFEDAVCEKDAKFGFLPGQRREEPIRIRVDRGWAEYSYRLFNTLLKIHVRNERNYKAVRDIVRQVLQSTVTFEETVVGVVE